MHRQVHWEFWYQFLKLSIIMVNSGHHYRARESSVVLDVTSLSFPLCAGPHAVTLRNVSEVLEFAVAYSASQLKRACLKFMCVNASALLEGRYVRRKRHR